MGITNWWALGAFVFIPAIIVLYVLKQKAKEYNISSLYLWRETYKSMVATTWWEKLRNNILLYLQLLIMLLLILALAGLYFNIGKSRVNNTILIIDTSGSMNTSFEDRTRLEVAKKKAVDYLNGLSEDTAITIVTCNASPKVELTSSTNRNEVVSCINNIEATDVAGGLNNANELVCSLATELDECEVVAFSDDDVRLDTSCTTLVDISSTGNNLSLDYVSYGISNETLSILAKVSNRGTGEMNSDVNLYLEDKLSDIKSINLAPGESEILYFDEIAASTFTDGWPKTIKAEINENDMLKEDNVAYEVIKETGKPRILLVTEQNIFLEKAIHTCVDAELYKTASAALPSGNEEFELYIYDGVLPEEWPEKGNVLILNPMRSVYLMELKGQSHTKLEKEDSETAYSSKSHLFYVEGRENGVYIETNNHEINSYFKDYRFGVNELQLMEKPIWAEGFLAYQDYSAGFVGVYEGRTIGVIGFDIHSSELPLQPEFPILMGQLLNNMVENQLIATQKITAGEPISLYADAETLAVTVEKNGEKEAITTGTMETIYTQTNHVGIYAFGFGEETGTTTEYVGVNYPSDSESDLTKAKATLTSNANQGEVVAAGEMRKGVDMKELLLLVVLAVLLIEWTISCRRSL